MAFWLGDLAFALRMNDPQPLDNLLEAGSLFWVLHEEWIESVQRDTTGNSKIRSTYFVETIGDEPLVVGRTVVGYHRPKALCRDSQHQLHRQRVALGTHALSIRSSVRRIPCRSSFHGRVRRRTAFVA